MSRKPQVAIIGPGRLGSALILSLQRAHYRVGEIVSRHPGRRHTLCNTAKDIPAHVRLSKTARIAARLVWFCVPDREIAAVARQLADSTNWEGKIAFHSSGALASDELDVLRRRGASVASVHPLMTFVSNSIPALRGVPFAIEGDREAAQAARQIVQALGGEAFAIRKQDKAAYHAWGAFISPLLIALLVAAERVADTAGVSGTDARKKMMPIIVRTLSNYEALGPARSFSGPIVRGEVTIVRSHLRALQKVPEARAAYLALARVALRYLPADNRKLLERVLKSL